MEALKDHNSKYYIRVSQCLITRNPNIVFVSGRLSRMATTLKPAKEDTSQVALAFLKSAEEWGGDSLAIYLIKEAIMAKGAYLIVNVAAGLVLGKEITSANAEVVQKANEGSRIFSDKVEFDKLTVAERCTLARPYLNDKEKDSTPDGDGFAAQAWKIVNRYSNPKPEKGSKTEAAGKEKTPAAPRAKGVKTLISDLFTSTEAKEADDVHYSVEEIMAKVSGTKASVTTAISDLRSEKYCGKGGVVNLERIGGKYALEGSKSAAKAKEADVEVQKALDEAKAKAKVEKDAKAKEAKAAKDAADAQKKTETAGVAQ